MTTTEGRLTPETEATIRKHAAPQSISIRILLNELDAVRRERDEARKDSARLDDLERIAMQSETMGITIGGICYFSITEGRKRLAEGDDLRDAIDAAMEKDGNS